MRKKTIVLTALAGAIIAGASSARPQLEICQDVKFMAQIIDTVRAVAPHATTIDGMYAQTDDWFRNLDDKADREPWIGYIKDVILDAFTVKNNGVKFADAQFAECMRDADLPKLADINRDELTN